MCPLNLLDDVLSWRYLEMSDHKYKITVISNECVFVCNSVVFPTEKGSCFQLKRDRSFMRQYRRRQKIQQLITT